MTRQLTYPVQPVHLASSFRGEPRNPWLVTCWAGAHTVTAATPAEAVAARVQHDTACGHYGTTCTHRRVRRIAAGGTILRCATGACTVHIAVLDHSKGAQL